MYERKSREQRLEDAVNAVIKIHKVTWYSASCPDNGCEREDCHPVNRWSPLYETMQPGYRGRYFHDKGNAYCDVCVEVGTFDKYEQTYPCPTIQALGEFAPNIPGLAKEDT